LIIYVNLLKTKVEKVIAEN